MPRTILVVDDNALERETLTNILKGKYNVIAASGGREMLSVLHEKAGFISAILLDIIMPEMDGFEALHRIREHAMFRQIPVVVATGLTDQDSQVKAMSLGANGYVFKPFNSELLLYTLGNTIDLREKSALANSLRRDPLTGLLSRTAFFETARIMIDDCEAGTYILASFDIENFKVINDQYGTAVGDEVLKNIAEAIAKAVSLLGGACCRYSADKFGLLYPAKYRDSETIKTLHEEAMASMSTGRSIRIRIGRYLVDDPAVPVSAMYDRATLAEESIRGSHDAYIADYTNAMRARLLNEQKIVNDMDRALRDGEFEPWFQPQYNHATGALIGAEALVRWKKDGKYIQPSDFVPVFERNGFIYDMDRYIWERVCVLLREWLDEGRAPLPVSINISRRDLLDRNFFETLTGMVEKHRIPYSLLRLEVTESAFADADGQISEKVGKLIDMGFTLEIDDFGSGYSSLNTLKDVPASILKLDMKFFENTKNQQRSGNIVESVVRMARWLGMAVIAEGVEDREQADYLESIGCYYIQGYYYARPMPVDDYEKLMDTGAKEPELTRLKTLETLDNSEFWNPKSMETLIFNSYVGGACIFEYSGGRTELLRVNQQYAGELGGLTAKGATLDESSLVAFLDDEGRKKLKDVIDEAMGERKEVSCEVTLKDGGHTEYVRVTMRQIASTGERHLFYCVIVNMTRQREAQRRQTESARQLEVIMSNVNGGVSAIQIDDNGASRLIFNNEKYFELYGYTGEQAKAVRLDVMSTIVPEDLPTVMEKVKKLKADGIPAIIDYRCVKRDGEIASLRANASLMYMEGCGEVIVSVVTDITEQRELSDKFKAVIDNINGGISAVYLRGDKPEFVIVNDRYYDMLGYSREQFEAEGRSIFDLIHPDDRLRVESQLKEATAVKGHFTMEYRFIRRDGAVRYALCNGNVIRLFGVKEPVQLTVISDITELRLAQQKEREAADKLSTVLNHAGNGITAIALRDGKPVFLFVNDKYFEIIGYSREEYRAKTESDIFAPVHPQDRERLRRQITELNKAPGSGSTEYRVIRGDGRIIWVRSAITITNLAGVEGPVQIGVFSDITAEREASEQLRFLNDSAHDILAQPDSDGAVNRTLEKLLAYFAGDRAYVIELDEDKQVSNNTYEKCAQGVTSEMERLQGVPFSVSEPWLELLRKDQLVEIGDVDALGESDGELRELLQAQDIRSLIVAPLWRDGVMVGYVGIDNPREATGQLGRLKALGDYIAILLTRRDLRRKIEHDGRAMLQLMNDTPGGFVRMKLMPSGVFAPVYSNEGFKAMVGMDHETLHSIYGRDVLQGVHPDDRETVRSAGERMVSGGKAETARFRVKNGAGEYIWLTLYGRMTRDEVGGTYLNVYYSDASRQVSEEIKQKELLDNLPCGAALYEYDGKSISVIHINKSYWQLVGRDPADYSKASVMDVIYGDDQPMVKQELDAAIRQDRKVDVDLRILCGGNVYKPFHITANITREDSGKYRMFAAYTPISEEEMSVQEMLPIALSTMMSASKDMSYVKDRDLRYICCSDSMARVLGLESARDIIGKTDGELFGERLGASLTADEEKVIRDGESVIGATERVPGPDGQIHLAKTSKYPIRDTSGSVIGLYGVSRDVTAQREKESQLELLTSSIPGGLATYSIDEHGVKPLYFNDGFCSFSGCSRQEYAKIIADDPLAFVFEEDKPAVMAKIKDFAKNKVDGHVNECIFRCHTRDGGCRWMSMKTVLSKQGEDQYIVNVVKLDITEQQEEKERLRISEELNRLAIEQSGNIITRFDVKKRTLTLPDSFNPIFVLPHVLTGMPEEQIALGRVSPDTAQTYRELFEGIVRGERSGTAVYRQESTKGWRWLEAQYTTVFSNAGEPVSAVITFADITEDLEKEVVYNKWQQSLEQRPEDSYTLFRCNLSKDASFDSREGRLLKVKFDESEMTFGQRTAEYVEQCVFSGDRERYLEFLDPDSLLVHYYRGHRSDALEYRENTADGGTRWLRLTVELVEYPNSKDVEAYLMYEDIDEQKKADLLTLERSEIDPLTGVLNRAVFTERMEHIIRASKPGEKHALLMLDVDDFKGINDTLGHGAGDQVLRDITTNAVNVLRHDDIIGRLGGDEFLIFLKGVPNREAAAAKAKQICTFKTTVDGADAAATVSIGMAMAPEDGEDFETLYRKVDDALYRRKKSGKNGFVFAGEQG